MVRLQRLRTLRALSVDDARNVVNMIKRVGEKLDLHRCHSPAERAKRVDHSSIGT
jgi:hypothetical protein